MQRTPPWPIAPLAGWLTVAPSVNVRQPLQRTTPDRLMVVPVRPEPSRAGDLRARRVDGGGAARLP